MEAFSHHDSVFQTNTNSYSNNNPTFFTQQTTCPISDQHHQINYSHQNIYSKSSSLDYSSPTNVCYYSDHNENVMNSMDENKKNIDGSSLNSAKLKVRREKISERMKLLQSLVPGCDKVTGKALMLEEIINYVQSLQHQVEFLSMKLACFNPTIYDFGVDPYTLMMRSERLNNGLASTTSLPFVQQCSPSTQPIVFADSIATSMFIPPHSSQYSGVGPSTLIQHGHKLSPFTEDNASQLWEVDGQKQKLMNLSSFFDNNNNMCSFN